MSVSVPAPEAARADAGPSDAWLLRRWRHQGDRVAREELVRRMMPLAQRIAAGYGRPQHRDDLVQVASLGLAKAIDRYDPAFGRPLRTYAIPTMRGEVRRWLRDHSWAVHVPRPLQERVLAVTKASERLSARDGRAPTPAAISAELGMELEDVLEALQAGRAYTSRSLDAPAGEGEDADRPFGETVGCEDERLERAEDVAALGELRHLLDDRERLVLHRRFVLDRTQSEIAREIGCSQMQISRILRRALARLAERAAAR